MLLRVSGWRGPSFRRFSSTIASASRSALLYSPRIKYALQVSNTQTIKGSGLLSLEPRQFLGRILDQPPRLVKTAVLRGENRPPNLMRHHVRVVRIVDLAVIVECRLQ